MKFGTTVWTYQWQPPYEEALKRIASLGFRAVELIAWRRETLDKYYTPQRIQELRLLLDDLGLELSEFVSTPPGAANPDPAKRKAAVEHFKHLVEVGVELGTNMVNNVSPMPLEIQFPRIVDKHLRQEWTLDFPTGANWQQNWDDYVDTVRAFCDICEDANVRYALEPHPYRWMRNAASMMRLMDHVNSPALGMNFDPSHLFPMGEISEQVVYEVGSKIFHCHFSDNDGTSNVHWRVGKGKINWKGVLKALQDVDYDGVISIELEDVPGVSRPGQESTSALDQEVVLSRQYLEELCKELDITVEANL